MKKQPTQNSFTTPKGYFEERQAQLKTLAKDPASPPQKEAKVRKIWWAAAAAAVVALVWLLGPAAPAGPKPIALNQLTKNEIVAFLAEDQYAVQWSLTYRLKEESIDSLFSDEPSVFSEDDLYQYLSNEPLENYNL